MRSLLILFILPLSLFAGNPSSINLSYSIQGEDIIMTWTSQIGVEAYEIYTATSINENGSINYRLLQTIPTDGSFQLQYTDRNKKQSLLSYYKIVGVDYNHKVLSESIFTANFINKDIYTVNIMPNFFSDLLEFEMNTKMEGEAEITVEDIINNFKKTETIQLASGYNTFAINLDAHESERYVVKINFANKSIYRLVEMENKTERILTSDE